eukprot:558123-Prymnesium_polylepis.1
MQGWVKGLGWVCFRLLLLTWSLGDSSTVSSSTCDTKSSIERRRLSPSPPICAWLQWKGGVIALGRARWWNVGR